MPAAPTELIGYATSESSVRLAWKDNSTGEDTFEVLRSASYAPRNVAFSGSRIRSVSVNTVQVDLTGLSPGYHAFAVRARNAAGASETSNSVAFLLPRKPCNESETGTCLQRGRFDVWVHFGTDDGTGHAKVKRVDLGDAATLIYFFDESNVEMLIKILDGCRINSRFWVFAAAATDLEYYLYVWDTTTGVAAIYYNSPGTAPRAVTDTQAFATCDR
ncbi:MAG: fibronectin type III domain-containing protein [Acidobacteriota bacterium]|nr:fibronectin type III domain-containing protein [Acidobacteriota bacterium]